ncbi:hypothetical protein APHAL10511_002520 [Amanita phalloides]|nr:hypothetical protein APHAL10511_002520 [Amanita phalloides]
MNSDYDSESAGKRLDNLAAERRSDRHSGFQLSRSRWPGAYKIVQNGSVMRLVFVGANSDSTVEHREVVAHIQGVLWRHDLPPFTNASISPNRAKFLRQSVSLTGLGNPTFDAALRGILDVLTFFSGQVPRDTLQGSLEFCPFGRYGSVDMANRYFTSVKDAVGEMNLPFRRDVDPQGILSRFAGANHIIVIKILLNILNGRHRLLANLGKFLGYF